MKSTPQSPLASRAARAGVVACAVSLAACVREYRPEYHPETRASYVQNVTYAQNAWVMPPPERVAPSADGTYAIDAELACADERPFACWRDCFRRASGAACLELASMYEAGYRVVRNHDAAQSLAARACTLGECGPLRSSFRGEVGSPGAVVVYGDFKGTVLIGH